MFGYVQVNQRELKIREYETYRSYYCGLCYALREAYARTGQVLLTYDMTFLVLLLTGLYEPAEDCEKRRCLLHPAKPHLQTVNEFTFYAADMTILLSYVKATDDWRDEHSHPKRALAMALYPKYRDLKKRYPRQAKTLERSVKTLSRLEREGCTDADLVSGQTGRFLGEIFVYREDLWQEDLRELGFYLGKYIYLLDAADDFDKDRKNHSFNILHSMTEETAASFSSDPQLEQNVRLMLTDLMARSSRAFERLPILKNAPILRNILYSGVWIRYAAICSRNADKPKER